MQQHTKSKFWKVNVKTIFEVKMMEDEKVKVMPKDHIRGMKIPPADTVLCVLQKVKGQHRHHSHHWTSLWNILLSQTFLLEVRFNCKMTHLNREYIFQHHQDEDGSNDGEAKNEDVY